MKENVGGRRQEQQVKVGAVHEGVPFPGLIESYRNHPACPETNQRTAPTERSFCQQIALCGLNSPSPLRPGKIYRLAILLPIPGASSTSG
jgi:hypothetical protein